MKKNVSGILSGIMAFSVLASAVAGPLPAYGAPAAANKLADGAEAAEILLKNIQEDVIKRKPTSESTGDFPEKFDLRDLGYVTPVKFQNPWGTCWGFAAIAAAETSILSEMGKTYEETGLDLSEHHLTYFARTHLTDGSSQDGEGVYMYDEKDIFKTGGVIFTATSLFSSGIGVVPESLVPYRGKNSRAWGLLKNSFYSPNDDWTVPEQYQFVQTYELEHSDLLPSPSIYERETDKNDKSYGEMVYVGYDQAATDTMKQALMDGKAISIAYAADHFSPDQRLFHEEPTYINADDNKWTHFTYDDAEITHGVTIVGWDDTIKRTDFLDHSGELYGGGDPHQPEGDGAWIVKNSWGAGTEKFPNRGKWGIEDENGQSTGYFYLSYYDRSLSMAETFEFDVDSHDDFIIDQYDYLQSDSTAGWLDKTKLQMANVFTAEYDQRLRGLSCETSTENTSVTYEVYLLHEGANTPTDGELVLTASAEYKHAGYHRLDLEETADIAKGQKYSVVVTQQIQYEGETYFGFSTVMALNESGTYEKNLELKKQHSEDFLSYYSKGIVNPGESYVYLGELDAWSDFSEVIPEIQKADDNDNLSWYDFDNFPIKAYHDFQNPGDYTGLGDEGVSASDLGYAKPAGTYNVLGIAVLLILLALVALRISFMVKNHKRKKLVKAQAAEIAELKARLAQLEAEACDASAEPEILDTTT